MPIWLLDQKAAKKFGPYLVVAFIYSCGYLPYSLNISRVKIIVDLWLSVFM